MKARVLAVYLPQFHPIPENDAWWGKGFTEWTNVVRAKPVFKGHYQPKLPSDLGFYDLRVPEVRQAQADLAREAGIEGFCYWHYWFGGGRRLLERPFQEVVASGGPDFPFCLAWANHSWFSGTLKAVSANRDSSRVLMEQTYPGEADYKAHFYALLDAFRDSRYIRVDGKLLFFIYNPSFEDVGNFIRVWRSLAAANGLGGFHFVAMTLSRPMRGRSEDLPQRIRQLKALGFDAVNTIGTTKAEQECSLVKSYGRLALEKFFHIQSVTMYRQQDINRHLFCDEDVQEDVYPTVLPNWDRTPRCGKNCVIYTDSTPQVFEELMKKAVELVRHKNPQHRLVLVRSWNEWGEGNYLEPDIRYGKGYLEAIKNANGNFGL